MIDTSDMHDWEKELLEEQPPLPNPDPPISKCSGSNCGFRSARTLLVRRSASDKWRERRLCQNCAKAEFNRIYLNAPGGPDLVKYA